MQSVLGPLIGVLLTSVNIHVNTQLASGSIFYCCFGFTGLQTLILTRVAEF